ncbi:segregation and condensation protein A [Peredibacter starrii]|uniref:Segregation and condensation protein A n=1 Tax=Peredibacter starrii TaxID=28202 RepID=A0AAX4HRT8_9BACT|nr:segregation/condensation protein A [Peredibacter starrii]WPU65885.1 segregation/condensation protein A [Peredibacter starrii]
MTENEILVKIDRFDGPLALLLHLVQKEEMRIQELELNTITHQYLDYLQKMQDLNFDVAGEYLYMAATLLYLKSQTIADESQDQNLIKITAGEMGLEIQTRGDLIKRLEELERFQRLGQRLWGLPKKGHEIFVKGKVDRKAIEDSILTPIDLQQLTETMMDLIRREKRKYAVVKRDRLSIKEKLVRLKSMLKEGDTTQFDKLLDENETGIIDKVITFISLLELARLKKLQIFQNEDKGSIYIEVKESLESFDPETANGFDPEGEANKPKEAAAPAEAAAPIQ